MSKARKSSRRILCDTNRVSTGKAVQKAAFIVRDLEPTKERTLKPDYEQAGKKRIKINTVNALHQAGDISGDAVTAAEWWYADYIKATHGHMDCLNEPLPRGYIKGDIHTYAISRGKAGERISIIREQIGLCAHLRLEMLLVREMSFSAMGRALFPQLGSSQARTKIAAQCALLLEMLSSVQKDMRKKKSQEKRLVLADRD